MRSVERERYVVSVASVAKESGVTPFAQHGSVRNIVKLEQLEGRHSLTLYLSKPLTEHTCFQGIAYAATDLGPCCAAHADIWISFDGIDA